MDCLKLESKYDYHFDFIFWNIIIVSLISFLRNWVLHHCNPIAKIQKIEIEFEANTQLLYNSHDPRWFIVPAIVQLVNIVPALIIVMLVYHTCHNPACIYSTCHSPACIYALPLQTLISPSSGWICRPLHFGNINCKIDFITSLSARSCPGL